MHESWPFCFCRYQVSTSQLVKSMVQDETQPHKTHNNQHEPPPSYPPPASPSPSMGRSVAPTTHGVAASYGPMLGTRGLVWQCHSQFLCLERQRRPHQKIEQWAGLGLNWPKHKRKTQQPTKCQHWWWKGIWRCGAGGGGRGETLSRRLGC